LKPVIVKFIVGFVLLTGLTGCAKVTPEALTPALTISPVVIPTSTRMTPSVEVNTLTPTETLAATQTPISITPVTLIVKTMVGTSVPPVVLPQDTPENTMTPEPTVQDKFFPDALIQINEPADLSQLSSPFRVQANVFPGAGNLVGVQLLGEDGRLMSDQLLKMVKSDSGWDNLDEQLQFEITTAGETAYLVISTQDEFGRRIAQSTSQIFLMQIGKSDIKLNSFEKQPFVVKSPKANATVKGGKLIVSGFAHPFNSNPIVIELLTESGGVLESKVVKLPRISEGDDYASFIAEIPYKVDLETPVRLSIRQRDDLLPNVDKALSSQLLTLEP
jgi:hypothetical protein